MKKEKQQKTTVKLGLPAASKKNSIFLGHPVLFVRTFESALTFRGSKGHKVKKFQNQIFNI